MSTYPEPKIRLLWGDSFDFRRLLVKAHPKKILMQPAQDTLRTLGDFALCAAQILEAYLEVFFAVRRAIQSSETPLESDLISIYETYDDLVRLLDKLYSLEGPALRSATDLEEYVIREFSYPPIIHYFIMRVVDRQDWGGREHALTEVPPLLDSVRAHVNNIAELAAGLRRGTTTMRQRFSATQLGEIKTLPAAVRHEVQLLVAQSSADLSLWASSASASASNLSELAVPTHRLYLHWSNRGHYFRVLEPAQNVLRGLGEYMICAADAIGAFFEVFLAIRRPLTSEDISPDAGFATIHARYEHLVRLLNQISSPEGPNIQSLNDLERYVVREFSYPLVIHFVVMRILDREDWGGREIALTDVPALLDTVCTNLKGLAQLAVELRVSAAAMRERFSAARMSDIKALPAETRDEVQILIAQTFGRLGRWSTETRADGLYVLSLAVPRLLMDGPP
ncbi:hypothetical protein HDZ31DRAFT_66168 [Schizophyllum fasciatum]